MFLGLNCDMGENYSIYKLSDDKAIMPLIDVANVACGFHASDPSVMAETVKLAKEHDVKVGAHPGFPDHQGFGRREMKMSAEEIRDCVIYQVGALKGFLEANGLELNHIKPHGALYGVAARNEVVAHAIADAAEVFGVPLYGMANTKHEEVYKARGLEFVAEYYVDLDYDKDGMVIISREHDELDPDIAVERALMALNQGKLKTVDGEIRDIDFDIICVHSDTPGAIEATRLLRKVADARMSK